MKSIVLDGDKIAEAIKKAKDKMINGEYDNNDLILRGDALKAIRQRCISKHLPFKSNTPVGARVLDALAAVYQVKPYKAEPKATVWHDAQTDPPKDEGPYIYWYKYSDPNSLFEEIHHDYGKGLYRYGCWLGDVSDQYDSEVLAWTELPAPPTKE